MQWKYSVSDFTMTHAFQTSLGNLSLAERNLRKIPQYKHASKVILLDLKENQIAKVKYTTMRKLITSTMLI